MENITNYLIYHKHVRHVESKVHATLSFSIYGRGHTNYDIQIIVVILKVTTRIFQRRPWI